MPARFLGIPISFLRIALAKPLVDMSQVRAPGPIPDALYADSQEISLELQRDPQKEFRRKFAM